MSNYPLVKFVASPAVGATVRFDFNDSSATASRRVEADFTLGSPTLQGDPDAVNVTYGYREPSFTIQVKGTKANALSALSALSRELLRQTNWLMVQLTATSSPVWFKTYRAGPQPLSLERVYVNTSTGGTTALTDQWRIAVPLVADAFAYGARETHSVVTVIQAEADSGANKGMRFALPTIKGDAPTALRVSVSASNNAGRFATWLVGCVSGDSALSDPVINIGTGDGFTAAGSTGAGSSDSAYFGGSYRALTIGAASPNLLTRLSGAFTGLPVGRYKVLMKTEINGLSAGAETALFQLEALAADGSGYHPVAAARAVSVYDADVVATTSFWVDLGEVSAPVNGAPPIDVGLTTSSVDWRLLIGTASGNAVTGRLDAFKLIPVSGNTIGSTTILKTYAGLAAVAGTTQVSLDGDDEIHWTVTLPGGALQIPVIQYLTGSFPVADPAQAVNVLLVMATDKGMASGTTIITKDAAATVAVSYHPRWLHIGDGT